MAARDAIGQGAQLGMEPKMVNGKIITILLLATKAGEPRGDHKSSANHPVLQEARGAPNAPVSFGVRSTGFDGKFGELFTMSAHPSLS